MNQNVKGNSPEISNGVLASEDKTFRLVENIERLREIIRLARESGKYQRDILKESKVGCQDAYFSKWLNGQANLAEADLKKLQSYTRQTLARYVDAIAKRHDSEYKIDNCIDLCAALYPHLCKSFSTHGHLVERLREQRIESYYNVYKYSYRKHGQILKSAALITSYKNDPARPFVFIEKQINADNQREDSAGVIFSKSYALWLVAQEVAEEQPRFILLTSQEPGFDDSDSTRNNHGTGSERLQCLYGFILEAYARYDSATGAPKGGFMSPIALQRVPEAAFLPQLGIDVADVFREPNVDTVLGQLLRDCGYRTIEQIQADMSIKQAVRDHMKNHPWGDTTRKSENRSVRYGGFHF